jgi:FxsC-like protein
VEPLRPDSGSDAPYFFFSYAHLPKPVGDDTTDPNLWIEKLFKDLCRSVHEMATAPPPQVGFMDSGIRHGAEWARSLSEHLAVCRTFVPLYSRHYFLSDNCGKEWQAFCGRVRNGHATGTTHVQQVIPAQWIPVPVNQHPREVQRIQFRPADLGQTYAEHGFYPLTHIDFFNSAYQLAVYELARKIVQVAEGEPAPPGPALEYESLPSAFTDRSRPVIGGYKPFHIVIAAPRLSELPADRSRDYYGTDAYGWNPYAPDLVEPLAQYASNVARYHGHHRPQAFSLLDYAEELLRDPGERPTAPAVLLIDPWVVTQRESRRLLEAYDRMTKPWIQFVVAWNTKDDGLTEKEAVLRDLLGTVLRTKLADGGRPARQVASLGVGTIEEMSAVLPTMIQTAGRHFLRYQNPPPAQPARR